MLLREFGRKGLYSSGAGLRSPGLRIVFARFELTAASADVEDLVLGLRVRDWRRRSSMTGRPTMSIEPALPIARCTNLFDDGLVTRFEGDAAEIRARPVRVRRSVGDR